VTDVHTCPDPLVLTRALSEGVGAELQRHLDACAPCASEYRSLERTVLLARQLPVPRPSPRRVELARAALVAAAEAGEGRPRVVLPRHSMLALAAGIAAFAGLAWLWLRPAPAPLPAPALVLRGTVHAQPGAKFRLVSGQPDEVVHLAEGTLAVEVEHLQPGERFRVVTGAGELEVRGTAFAVRATSDRMDGVRVDRGRVEVRPQGEASRLVAAGEAWGATLPVFAFPAATPPAPVQPVPAAPAAPRPAPMKPVHRPVPAPVITAPPTLPAPARSAVPSAQEQAFDAGFTALKAGEFAKAADGLSAALASDPRGPLAEELRFWGGVAAARAGRASQALGLLRELLVLHPSSAHAGEAAAAVGWLLVNAGDAHAAEPYFRQALQDRNAEVRASAQQGLNALAGLPQP
jgi:TolA-binding protein